MSRSENSLIASLPSMDSATRSGFGSAGIVAEFARI
jgi:hypothetical protein